jgi:ADP-heptose:LPS heptosyltransferase
MSQALILQLARLGDAIQSLPVITSLHTHFPEQQLDLLCAAPLVPLGQLFPGIHGVYPWEGEKWHSFSAMSNPDGEQQLEAAGRYLTDLAFPDYSLAYNLNNHPRSILASHMFSERVIGAGYQGPLNPSCPPWVGYLQKVARERGNNRIHLADAFCGLSGVKPAVVVPTIQACDSGLPSDLVQIVNDSSLVRIGIVLGAGDVDRRVPLATWRQLIEACVHHLPHCLCVLIGGAGERETALALEDQFSPLYLSRILNCVGRTTLPQLAQVFNRCQWVIGSDTGPLHLGVACGARAIGWYFSRARVHETGPYGVGHYVWQHRNSAIFKNMEVQGLRQKQELPYSWPVMETIQLILDERVGEDSSEWNLWTSHRDEWGVFYTNEGKSDDMVLQRKETWERLSALRSHQDAFLMPREMIAG